MSDELDFQGSKIESEERRTTSIKVTPSVWRQFKKYAIDENADISTLIEEMIREETIEAQLSQLDEITREDIVKAKK